MSEIGTANEIAQLGFADGDLELMYGNGAKGRYWLHDIETFHKVVIDPTVGEEHVEFRMLSDGDYCDMLEQPSKPYQKDYLRQDDLRFMAGVAFSRAVFFPGASDWVWYATAVPLPTAMNRVAEQQFVPLGAHELKLRLLHGDGEDELFTSTAMVHAIAEGYLPVSTTARHFRHDMSAHSLGMLAMDAKTMQALRSICTYMVELELKDALAVKYVNDAIISNLDYFTFYRNFVSIEIQGADSLLLEGILSSDEVQESPYRKKIFSAARSGGLNIKSDGSMQPNKYIENYHTILRSLLAGNLEVAND